MYEVVIVGQANVGKSQFLINFAKYIGVRQLIIKIKDGYGNQKEVRYSPAEAERFLVSTEPHFTRTLQAIDLSLPSGKTQREFTLVDSPGLAETIHPNEEVRHSMVLTLRRIREARLVLHMIDAVQLAKYDYDATLDLQIARYAAGRGGYVLLANKIDMPEAAEGLKRIQEIFRSHYVLPVSALKNRGFNEVKTFVWRYL